MRRTFRLLMNHSACWSLLSGTFLEFNTNYKQFFGTCVFQSVNWCQIRVKNFWENKIRVCPSIKYFYPILIASNEVWPGKDIHNCGSSVRMKWSGFTSGYSHLSWCRELARSIDCGRLSKHSQAVDTFRFSSEKFALFSQPWSHSQFHPTRLTWKPQAKYAIRFGILKNTRKLLSLVKLLWVTTKGFNMLRLVIPLSGGSKCY